VRFTLTYIKSNVTKLLYASDESEYREESVRYEKDFGWKRLQPVTNAACHGGKQ